MPNCQKTIRRQCHGKHIPPLSSVKEFSVKTISRALTCSNEDRPFLKFVNSKSHPKYSVYMLESYAKRDDVNLYLLSFTDQLLLQKRLVISRPFYP